MTIRRTGVAALAACGVLGMVPAAAQASSAPVPVWTRQHPAAHPFQRAYPSMAYDAATGNVVLFGGQQGRLTPTDHDTWTWDGTNWTEQHPAASPVGRYGAAMAYDAATGSVVLFGGDRGNAASGTRMPATTWAWDGTTWAEQATAVHPGARVYAAMAYDAATGNVVLFGGERNGHLLGDTWTWDGTTWTQQHPAAHPGARVGAAMAYDPATGNVVLFGGDTSKGIRGDTWTWNGTTWTKRAPAASPPARYAAAMAYDAATRTPVLFGGIGTFGVGDLLADTWTWDGTTWTQRTAGTVPTRRAEGAMAYDAAAGHVVLFGGTGGSHGGALGYKLPSTWTWG